MMVCMLCECSDFGKIREEFGRVFLLDIIE
jgi:hypothetical protein